MLKHLLTVIWNQRKSNFWILLELLIVSVCLWYVVDYMGGLLSVRFKPLGFDIAHTYRIDLSEKSPDSEAYIEPYRKTTSLGEDILTILERIRQYPAIDAVSLSVSSQPYGATHYGNNSHFERIYYKDTEGITAQQYWVTPSFFDVFEIRSQKGGMGELKQALQPHTVIISPEVEEELMKTESALGKEIRIGEESTSRRVEAICHPIRWTEYLKSNPCYYRLMTHADIVSFVTPENLQQVEICIRVRPEADHGFEEQFVKDMGQQLLVGNLYLMDVRSSSLIRKAIVSPLQSEVSLLLIVLGFLLINIFIGISGTFWLRTRSRRSEMGLRIAMGSTRTGLQALLILEGIVMLVLAMLPALFINLNIGLTELVNVYWMEFTFYVT
ncbi:MAG: ABC transporter permease [Tannerellaceae bacterium]|nr:ABC transporter permease [Tannerellaceae bacterium]